MIKNTVCAAALLLTATGAHAQLHTPLCEDERAKAKAAIAVMDQEIDWLKKHIAEHDGQDVRPHDLAMIQAYKDRSNALQVLIDNHCLVASSEDGFRKTIQADQANIKDLEGIMVKSEKKLKEMENDRTRYNTTDDAYYQTIVQAVTKLKVQYASPAKDDAITLVDALAEYPRTWAYIYAVPDASDSTEHNEIWQAQDTYLKTTVCSNTWMHEQVEKYHATYKYVYKQGTNVVHSVAVSSCNS